MAKDLTETLPLSSKKPYHYNWDRPVKGHPIIYTWAPPVANWVVNKRFKHVYYYGAGNIPDDGGFIICANHVTGFDPIVVMNGFHCRRQCYFMAKQEFFQAFYMKYVMLTFGAFPVNRGRADRDSIRYCQKIIDNGYGLMIFAQGHRDKEGKRPTGFMPGAALIARECKSDVVPVSIHKFQEPGEKKMSLVVRYGKIIPYEELGFTEGSRKAKELRSATSLIENRVAEQWDLDDRP